jgi:ABC-type dipeptide/oligopeptide/nickel transport system ATPase component
MKHLLAISNLAVDIDMKGSVLHAVKDVTLTVGLKETVVIAGESGSGKTITALAITDLLPSAARIISGDIIFKGQDLRKLSQECLRTIRGKDISYVFQEPTSYLNPVLTVGEQIRETVIYHQGLSRVPAKAATIELLRRVKINAPQIVYAKYPFQLSGGMNQRVFLAMALASQPALLIADEPTTALDVTIEAEILGLLMELKAELGFSLLFITHNLSIARRIAQRMYIMYQGRVVEEAHWEQIFSAPQHAHTRELLAAYEKIGKL